MTANAFKNYAFALIIIFTVVNFFIFVSFAYTIGNGGGFTCNYSVKCPDETWATCTVESESSHNTCECESQYWEDFGDSGPVILCGINCTGPDYEAVEIGGCEEAN